MRRFVIGLVAATLCIGAASWQVSLRAEPQAGTAPAATGSGSADLQEGRRLFLQNCSVCHIPPVYFEKAYGPLLHKDVVADAPRARALIMAGRARMPGFQYALDVTQVDAIIAYLSSIDATAPVRPVLGNAPASKPSFSGSRVVLTGNVKSSKGENMEGVTVSAKGDGQSITTSVYTDKDGNYYFPPMGSGAFRVWAQAVGFEAGRATVALNAAARRQDFRMKETTDFVRQLTGGQYVDALPVDSAQHRRMRDVFVHSCTTCHPASLALQNRFDEAGWNAIIASMLAINGSGEQGGRPSPHLQHFQKELAAYLAEMRGPGPSPMQFKVPPRPSGAATLPVVYQYGIPLEEHGGYSLQDGTDWSLGTPSNSYGGRGLHDAAIDFDGNIWFTYLVPSKKRTYGRIDTKTGEVTDFVVPGRDGYAATTHGLMRGPDGSMWFTVRDLPGPGGGGGFGRVGAKTGKMDVFRFPADVSGTSVDVDWDPKSGYIWGGVSNGVIRLDPKTGEWKYVKSPERGTTYGVAVDRTGTAWWAQISLDKMVYSDGSGEPKEFKVPKNAHVSEKDVTAEDVAFYAATPATPSVNPPWHQAPRRLAVDKTTDDVWVSLFIGSNLMRLNGRTLAHKIYRLPGTSLNSYMPAIDSKHNVWISVQGDDSVAMFNPATEVWTVYRWPSHGVAQRHNSVSDRNGVVEVVTALFQSGNVGRMVIRTERDLQTLKSQVQTVSAR